MLLFLLASCAPAIGGSASFPVLSSAKLPAGFEAVAKVDEMRCSHVVLLLWAWGEDPNHEALVTDMLEKHHGDAIADAELTYFDVPAVLYVQNCARLQGTVVRRTASGSSAPPATPAEPAAPAAEEASL